MRSSLFRTVTVAVGVGALVALEGSTALASEGHRHDYQQVVHVTGDGSQVHLDRSSVQAGSIRFRVDTTTDASQGQSSDISLFQPRPGKTTTDVLSDFADEFGADPAKGTRELERDATFHGLADIGSTSPMTVTENLDPGVYYLVDLGNPPEGKPPAVTEFDVSRDRHGVEQDSDLRSQAYVAAVEPDRWVAPRVLPHRGTLTFTNRSGTLHFLDMTPVTPGTTAQDIVAFLNSGDQGQPPFATGGPSGGADVLSPGGACSCRTTCPRGPTRCCASWRTTRPACRTP